MEYFNNAYFNLFFDVAAPEEEVEEKTEQKAEDQKELILFNDDVNTFDHVIDSLMDICDHDMVQAEQCAFIVHYKGKCTVKKGSIEDLKPMCEALLDRGLSAEVSK